VQGVSKSHASKSAALLVSAFRGDLSHHMTMMYDKEEGGGAVGKGEDIPARAETPVSIYRRQQGGTLEAWESVDCIDVECDVLSRVGLEFFFNERF
jgi:hypothetical protein